MGQNVWDYYNIKLAILDHGAGEGCRVTEVEVPGEKYREQLGENYRGTIIMSNQSKKRSFAKQAKFYSVCSPKDKWQM